MESIGNLKKMLKLMGSCQQLTKQSSFAKSRKYGLIRIISTIQDRVVNRLPADFIRDNALALKRYFEQKVGGPKVNRTNPDGLWMSLEIFSFKLHTYRTRFSGDLHRRSMYTFAGDFPHLLNMVTFECWKSRNL